MEINKGSLTSGSHVPLSVELLVIAELYNFLLKIPKLIPTMINSPILTTLIEDHSLSPIQLPLKISMNLTKI